MKKAVLVLCALLSLLALPPLAAGQSLLFSVNLGGAEELGLLDTQQNYQALTDYLSKATGASIKLVVGQDATTALQHTRTGYYAILLAPAHVIGSALKYGYEPVARFAESKKAVFVAPESAHIRTLAQAKGKRLGLPGQDSLVTCLARGELNAQGISMRSYFGSVTHFRYQDAALFAMGIGQSDIVAVEEGEARKWLAKNPGVIVAESQAVPGLSVAVNATVPPALREKIRAALLRMKASPEAPLLRRLHTIGFVTATREDFQHVSTLGYFTPKVLPGATVIDAAQAKTMMEKGVPLFDVRVAYEYQEGHIKGAVSVPYKENSAKEVGFDPSLDSFDLSRLPKDKQAPIIFACNGPECWKSYKSARVAVKNGYRKVYWFRGGYPAWKASGYPVE